MGAIQTDWSARHPMVSAAERKPKGQPDSAAGAKMAAHALSRAEPSD